MTGVLTRLAIAALLLAASGSAQDEAPGAPASASRRPDVDPFAFVATNPVLRDVEFQPHFDYAPVVVAVQASAAPDPEREKYVSWNFGSWGCAFLEHVQKNWLQPAGLVVPTSRTFVRILVLTQSNTYDSLRTWAGIRDAHDDASFFAPQLPAVVVLDRGTALDGKYATECLRPMLHAMLHERLEACGKGGEALPLWLVEGLGERIASHSRDVRDAQPLGVYDLESLRRVAGACVDRLVRIAAVRPLDALVHTTTLAELDAQSAGLAVDPGMPLDGLSHESSLFLQWLDEGDAHHPGRGAKLVTAWLASKPGGERPGLPAAPADLEGDFVGWVQEQIALRRVRIPASVFTLKPETAGPGEIRPGVLVQSEDLALPADDVDVERARALVGAARGDLAGAIARCGELSGRSGLAPDKATALKTDQRLLTELQDLRRRWLEAHVGKVIEFHDGDAPLRTTLVRMDGEVPVVKDKGRERPLTAAALRPAALATQLMAPGNVQKGADDEARSLAWLLAEDQDWKEKTSPRIRKDAGPGGAALLDARKDYDAALARGAAIETLDQLAQLELPVAGASDSARESWLALLRKVFGARSVPLVSERLAVLRALGGRVLRARFDDAPLSHVPLAGKVEDLGHGRVRATWSFADAGQLADWTPRTFDDLDMNMPLASTPAPEGLTPQDGWVIARGSGEWRCRLAFAAPFSVDYDVRYDPTPAESAAIARGDDVDHTDMVQFLGVRMCADDYGSGLSCLWQGDLYAVDKRTAAWDHGQSSARRVLIGLESHIRVEHDGQTLKSIVDGQPSAIVAALKRTTGGFEIWHHTARPIALRNLVIEGRLDPDGLGPIRDEWVSAALAALGAGD